MRKKRTNRLEIRKRIQEESGRTTRSFVSYFRDEKKKDKQEFTKNVVVKLGNIPEDLDRDALKEIFGTHEKVAFVDYQKGSKEVSDNKQHNLSTLLEYFSTGLH